MAFASLTAELNLKTANFSKNLAAASSQLTAFMTSSNGTAKKLSNAYGTATQALKTHALGLKDVARIVQGILISQTFYAAANAIQEATRSLLAFNEALDYANVTYAALFGDTELASSFLETLKDQAVSTMFSFEDLTEASKKLLAYGINYKNLGYITEGLTNLSTMSGDPAAIERISRALGQIYTKGYLKAEEMRQLADAYVPIYKIVQEKFGLTSDDMGNIGNLRLPSSEVINAVIDYANEQFGAVGEAAMYTISGLKNKIVDSVKVMGVDMLQPFTVFFKSFLNFTANTLAEVQTEYEKFGAGGIFEYLVPNTETQQVIRQFLATLQNLFMSILRLVNSIMPFIKALADGLLDAFNIIIPIVTLAVNVLAAFLSVLTSNTTGMNILTGALLACAAAWVIFKAKMLGAMILAVVQKLLLATAKATLFLAAALTAHPILTILGLIAAGFIGVAVASGKAENPISKLLDKLNGFNGKSSKEVLDLGEAVEETTEDSDRFNEKLDGTSDALDDVEESAKKARKGLLSFDEVFKLTESNDETTGVDTDALDGLLPGLDGIGGSLIPEIPDFGDFAKNFVDALTGDLFEALKRIMSGGLTGALIGGLIGFTIGGLVTGTIQGAFAGAKLGAKIGAVVGGAFAGFWSETYDKMSEAIKQITTGAAVGGFVGGLIGLVLGAFVTRNLQGALTGAKYGAMLGTLVGTSIGSFWALATGTMTETIGKIVAGGAAGSLAGGLVGFVIGAFATKTLTGAFRGAELGSAIGMALGAGLGAFWGSASSSMGASIAKIAVAGAEGALIGGLVGMVLGAFATRTIQGAFAGAKYGAAIGGALDAGLSAVFSNAETSLGDRISTMFSSIQAASTGMMIGALVGMIIGAVVGVFAGGVGALPGARLGATLGSMAGGLIGMIVESLKSNDVGAKVGEWISGIGDSLKSGATAALEWFKNNWQSILLFIISPIAGAANYLYENNDTFKGWVDNFAQSISEGFAKARDAVVEWSTTSYNAVVDWHAKNLEKIDNWATSTAEKFNTWKTETKISIATWVLETSSDFQNWRAGVKERFSSWKTETVQSVKDWASETSLRLGTWAVETGQKIANWRADTIAKLKTWRSETNASIGAWVIETAAKFTGWYSKVKTGMSNWVTSMKTSLKSWWKSLWDPSTWSSGWSLIKNWFSSLFTSIKDWFAGIGSNIKGWWDGLWGDKSVSVDTTSYSTGSSMRLSGHAAGGVFNREHIARLNEGNKAEAVIPLENASAMQPFVDAVSNGLTARIAPILATAGAGASGGSESLPPLYVGTLIADDKGLKQLERKLNIIRLNEEKRGN